MTVTVTYRSGKSETFHDVTELERSKPGAVMIRVREYRGTRTVTIPWDLIERVETL